MAAGAKERAHEVLSALLREVKDEPRVRRIVDDALLRLRESRCRPCWWKTPKIGDDALECYECGHKLPMGEISPPVWVHVLGGYERRHGPEATDDFRNALYAAKDAKFPSPSTRRRASREGG